MKSIVQKEIAKGNMGKDTFASTQINMYTNVDVLRPPLVGARIPSARVYHDICIKCGKEHIVRIEKGHVTIPSSPGVQPIFA